MSLRVPQCLHQHVGGGGGGFRGFIMVTAEPMNAMDDIISRNRHSFGAQGIFFDVPVWYRLTFLLGIGLGLGEVPLRSSLVALPSCLGLSLAHPFLPSPHLYLSLAPPPSSAILPQ